MKQYLILIFLMFFKLSMTTTQAQQIISGAGANFQTTGGSVSWSLGEIAIETFTNESFIITQGFQQSHLTITNVSEIENFESEVIVYPNPAHNYLNLVLENTEGVQYFLYSVNGQLVENKVVSNDHTQINFKSLNPGIYLLKILRDDKEVNSFKVLKN